MAGFQMSAVVRCVVKGGFGRIFQRQAQVGRQEWMGVAWGDWLAA
ncbi:MAG: hypothetical protein ACOX6W_12580 [Lentisphaeria bacterium]